MAANATAAVVPSDMAMTTTTPRTRLRVRDCSDEEYAIEIARESNEHAKRRQVAVRALVNAVTPGAVQRAFPLEARACAVATANVSTATAAVAAADARVDTAIAALGPSVSGTNGNLWRPTRATTTAPPVEPPGLRALRASAASARAAVAAAESTANAAATVLDDVLCAAAEVHLANTALAVPPPTPTTACVRHHRVTAEYALRVHESTGRAREATRGHEVATDDRDVDARDATTGRASVAVNDESGSTARLEHDDGACVCDADVFWYRGVVQPLAATSLGGSPKRNAVDVLHAGAPAFACVTTAKPGAPPQLCTVFDIPEAPHWQRDWWYWCAPTATALRSVHDAALARDRTVDDLAIAALLARTAAMTTTEVGPAVTLTDVAAATPDRLVPALLNALLHVEAPGAARAELNAAAEVAAARLRRLAPPPSFATLFERA